MNEYIKSDLYCLTRKITLRAGINTYFKSSTFRWTFQLVRSSGLSKLIGYVLWKTNRSRKRINIPRQCDIGYGLYIGHGGPVVINPTDHIGNNCNLSQFDTIVSHNGQAATIGDNVYIGPNVCVVEDVKIGNNVTIGASSVVTKDIPDNATAVENYAKVINYDSPGRFIKKRYKK